MKMTLAVNPKKLWLLLSVLWCSAVLIYYYPSVTRSYVAFSVAEIERTMAEGDARFRACLEDNGTSWGALAAEFGRACREETQAQCRGSLPWQCAENYLTDSCIKAASKEPCRSIKFVNIEEIKAPTFKEKWAGFWRPLIRFVTSAYGESFNFVVVLFIGGPILLAALPRAARFGWRWLTTT